MKYSIRHIYQEVLLILVFDVVQIFCGMGVSWMLAVLFAFTQIDKQRELLLNPITIGLFFLVMIVVSMIGKFLYGSIEFRADNLPNRIITLIETLVGCILLISMVLIYYKTGNSFIVAFVSAPVVALLCSSWIRWFLYWRNEG